MFTATLTTDYGNTEYYVASLKGNLLSACGEINIVDVTHQIPTFDIIRAAYQMKNVYSNFPPYTVHICTINLRDANKRLLLVNRDNHFFVLPDNGLICLIFPDRKFEAYVINDLPKTFKYKDAYLKISEVCNKLKSGTAIEDFATYTTSYYELNTMMPIIRGDSLIGQIIHVDNYTNLISNITKDMFYELVGNHKFLVQMRGVMIDNISLNYEEVNEGDTLAMFNESNLLQISIHKNIKNNLLGMKIGDSIMVDKKD